MFTKSLLFAATLALSAEAVMVKSKASSLVGVNVAALSDAELAELRVQTAAAFSEHMVKNGLHAIAKEENEALQDNYIAAEAQIQTLNSQSKTCEFGHNVTSTMSTEQVSNLNGAKAPEGLEENVSLMLAAGNNYGLAMYMSTQEYQEFYDEEWEVAQSEGYDCQEFDTKFSKDDDDYMTGQRKNKHTKYVEKKQKMTEDEFNAYWQRVMRDRTDAQDSITRCFDDNYDDHNNNDDNNNVDNNNDNNQQADTCHAGLDSYVWGDQVVAPIKNQRKCASCYAFAAMTVLESALAIKTQKPVVQYSEQQIVDCQSNYEGCFGCRGGWSQSMLLSTQKYPVTTTEVYPYTGKQKTCDTGKTSEGNTVSADQVYQIDPDNDSIKEALCTGPISLSVKSAGPFKYYHGGVMTSADCPYNNDLDHLVSAIGWELIDGQDVLIVRNSWGANYGDDGYIKMAMDGGNGGFGPCGMMANLYSATVSVTI